MELRDILENFLWGPFVAATTNVFFYIVAIAFTLWAFWTLYEQAMRIMEPQHHQRDTQPAPDWKPSTEHLIITTPVTYGTFQTTSPLLPPLSSPIAPGCDKPNIATTDRGIASLRKAIDMCEPGLTPRSPKERDVEELEIVAEFLSASARARRELEILRDGGGQVVDFDEEFD